MTEEQQTAEANAKIKTNILGRLAFGLGLVTLLWLVGRFGGFIKVGDEVDRRILDTLPFLIFGGFLFSVIWRPISLLNKFTAIIYIFCGPLFLLSVALYSPPELARSAHSAANLKEIGFGIAIYENSHGDEWPSGFEPLIEEGHISLDTLQYPRYEDDEVDYVLIDSQQAGELPDDALVACERTNFRKEGRNVLSKSGSVKWMAEEDFQEALKKPENAPMAAALKRGPQPLKLKEE